MIKRMYEKYLNKFQQVGAAKKQLKRYMATSNAGNGM